MKLDFKQWAFFKLFMSLKTSYKVIVSVIFALVIIDIFVVTTYLRSTKYSSCRLQIEGLEEDSGSLIALNYPAIFSKVSKSGYVYYKFTPEQQEQILKFYNENGSVSISVGIMMKAFSEKKFYEISQYNQPFYLGLLTSKDFDGKGKVSKSMGEKILSGTDLRAFVVSQKEEGYSSFENALALEKNIAPNDMPCGLFVYSSLPIKIFSVQVQKAKIGFDFTGEVPFYGVCSNGGAFGSVKEIDFSGASMVFPVQNSAYSVMPKIEIGFFEEAEVKNTENPLKIKINFGGEVLTVYKTCDIDSLTIQTQTLTSPFSRAEISSDEDFISRFIMSANDSKCVAKNVKKVLYPIKTDPGLMLGSRSSMWRCADYELYAWDRFPNILFFDTKDYKIQSDFFRRLAFFVEKAGYKGRILSDAELGNLHGYNAHDYSSESLARFFNEVERTGSVINEKEILLREILLANGIILRTQTGYIAGNGAIISISQESAPYLRVSLCAHEIWHGLFFTDEDFRNTTAAIYYTIDQQSMDFLHGFWNSQPTLSYDTHDIYLMHNEFMAYIMQQPLNSVAKYFIQVANRYSVNKANPSLCSYVRSTEAKSFEDAAKIFDSYVFDRWGLNCGRVFLLIR